MMKITNTEVWGFNHALRGMRNPMNSWKKGDSKTVCPIVETTCEECKFNAREESPCAPLIGPNDMKLAQSLIKGGGEHRKYMRQIFVSVDITAPLYWWKEFDTYKVGTVANSCSTMHKIHAKRFTLEDFSCEHLTRRSIERLDDVIDDLNYYRDLYLNGGTDFISDSDQKDYEPKDKDIWWQMIQLLPSSYNQKRTVTMNYENLRSMYFQRKNHKLDEWYEFCSWIESLPYAKELITYTGDEKYE